MAYKEFLLTDYNKEKDAAKVKVDKMKQIGISGIVDPAQEIEAKVLAFKDTPHNCAKTSRVIFGDQNFEKKRNSSALFVREINLVTQPSFECEQGINSQVQTVCSNADAVLGQSRILCKVQNVVQIEHNLCKTGAAQAAAALFIK